MKETKNKKSGGMEPRPPIPELPAMLGLIVMGIADMKRALKAMMAERKK